MIDIAVIDYGMGNLRSVSKAIEYVAPQLQVVVTSRPEQVREAARVVFPGQGAMPDCMRELDARGLRAAVMQAAQTKPFLGICIGLQMLFELSEEGNVPGLGLLGGRVVRFASEGLATPEGEKLKIPHMGWNEVEQSVEHPLWYGIAQGSRFYFVHSYYPVPSERSVVAAQSLYGVPFACAVAKGNLFAVQFHPEKSQAAGLQLLHNFLGWDGRQGQSSRALEVPLVDE